MNRHIQTLLDLLEQDLAQPLPKNLLDKLEQYLELVRYWNDRAGLVSKRDVFELEKNHVIDSLSLAGYVHTFSRNGGEYLDIGSGCGFPAIPIMLALPEVKVVLVERSEKRAGFLRKACAVLGLKNLTIHAGEFPTAVKDASPAVITARAVERPAMITKKLVPFIQFGAVFLCQFKDAEQFLPRMFHVEHVRDKWSQTGLRRGDLYLVRCHSEIPRTLC